MTNPKPKRTPAAPSPADIAARNAANALEESIRRNPAKAAREMIRLRKEAEQWRGKAQAIEAKPASVTAEEWNAMDAEQKVEARQLQQELDGIRQQTADIEARIAAKREPDREELRRLRIEIAARQANIDPRLAAKLLGKDTAPDGDSETIDKAIRKIVSNHPYLVLKTKTAPPDDDPDMLRMLMSSWPEPVGDYNHKAAMRRLKNALDHAGL